MRKTPLALNTSDFWRLNDLIDALYVIVHCHLRAKKSQAADCGHRNLAARPELFRARRVRGEPRTRPLQPNLASGLSRERVEGRLALALRRLVSRHMGLRLVLVRFRFLFFLISFLSLRHGDPPVCSLDPPF
jgi:hypothetical protein